MIKLDNIKIKYNNNVIIKQGSISLFNGEITCISGKSGCGKTSLLYLIGLLTTEQNYSYYLDDQLIDLHDNKKIELIRQNKIGFILQDNTILEDLSVIDNIFFHNNDNKLANELLSYFDLITKKDVYPKNLSAGEKRRLSICIALAKEPAILIGDEITASLDPEQKNNVFQKLKHYALENNICVVLASHDDVIINNCNHLYEIRNQEIIELRHVSLSKPAVSKSKDHVYNLKKYLKAYQKKHYFNYLISTFLIAIALLMCSAITSTFHAIETDFNQTFDTLSPKKIGIIKLNEEELKNREESPQSYENDIPYIRESWTTLTDKEIQAIEDLENVEDIYPYYELEYRIGTVYINKKSFIFPENTLISLQPYYQNESSYDYRDDGIYISQRFSDDFNIKVNDTIKIPLTVGFAQNIDLSIEKVILETKVIGIKKDDTTIVSRSENSELVLALNPYYLKISDKQFYDLYQQLTPTLPPTGSYIIFATKNEYVPIVIENLKKTFNESEISYTYPIYKEMETMKQNQLGTEYLVEITVSVMIIGLLTLIKYIQLKNRQNELNMLRVNGISNKKIISAFCQESLIQSLKVLAITMIIYIFISLPNLFLEIKFPNLLIELSLYARLSTYDLIILIIVAILSFTAPTYLVLRTILKKDITTLLRETYD